MGEGGLLSSLLLETDPDDRFSHLELSTASGLLTLHPEPDRTLHGNRVDAGGVGHVVGLAWNPAGIVLVEGSGIALATAIRLAWRTTEAGGAGAEVMTLRIGLDLSVAVEPVTVVRLGDDRWRIGADGPVSVGPDGLPPTVDGEDWPLEA